MISSNDAIARVSKVPLREVWKNEARDFSSWLGENLDLLEELLGFSISFIQNNAPAGDFFIDILAEDIQGDQVVIENQLERTDHDHLGKMITYISSHEAKTGIWISKDPREEHEKAVEWLNEISPADVKFYLLKVEALRIGDSKPAPVFTIVSAPERGVKERGEEKKKLAKRHLERKKFWELLLTKAKEKTDLHGNVSAPIWDWIGTGAGRAGMTYTYTITKKFGGVELYIDKGKGFEKLNKKRFDDLHKHKTKIENIFGGKLDWQRLDTKRACRITKKILGSGLYDENEWPALQEKMIDAMIHLEKSLKGYISQLD